MPGEHEQVEAAIRALESQRALLGDAVVDTALAPLRAKLATLADERPAQALKQVTIVFVDVVGSTTLSQRIDPEETSDVMDGALAKFAGIVTRHGGKVLQYAGDSVLAAFGAIEAREDDPERAVRAGLALLEEGREQGALVKAKYGHDGFNVRVGVHTGDVLLGGGVGAEDSIRGQAVNVAARMEQTAPAGALRISHDTYRHVRGMFTVEAQPPLAVKGVDEPMITYLVAGARPRAFRAPTRGIEGVETRMIGRDAELARLQDAFRRVCGGAPLAAITVVADAGVGKSRLLYEFRNWLEACPERFRLFQGRADPQMQSRPYGLLRDILAWWLEITDSDSMDAAKHKIEQGVAPLFEADDGDEMAQAHAHLLGHLIGLDFSGSRHVKDILDHGTQIRNRAFHAAAQMFRRVGALDEAAVVLVLDDLHWADDGSLDFLHYLADFNRDMPMLVLALTRPSLFERRAEWGSNDDVHHRMDLAPLDGDLSQRLADELLKRLPEVPLALRELVTGVAEGNPFYMEELVKMLVDQGAIDIHGDHWTVDSARLLATRVPQTLTGILQARLDTLEPNEKRTAQQAAVIGFVFWDRALAAIDANAIPALPSLTLRELVIPRPDAGLDGIREYAFHHQLLHQVTYDTVLARLRRDYHARTAMWLVGLTGARANDFLGVAAEHFDKAGDTQRACELYVRAAEHASGRYANEAIVDYVTRALALLAEDERPDALQLRWRLLAARERALDLRGRRAEQQADVEAMQRLAEALDDDRRRADAAKRRSYLAMRTSDTRMQELAARQAIELAERGGDVEVKLRAQNLLATAWVDLGDLAGAEALAVEGLAEARRHELRRVEGSFLNTLGLIAVSRDDVATHLEMGRQQYQLLRELGDRPAEAVALLHLGISFLGVGEETESRRWLEAGLRLSRAVGDRVMEPYAQTYLALIALRQGDPASALPLARAALDTSLAVQNIETQIASLFYIADAELAFGRNDAAAAAYERAQAIAVANDEVLRFDAAAGLARVALARGDDAGAMRALEGLFAHLADGGTLDGTESRHSIRETCYRVLARAGDPRAAEMLATAHAELQRQAADITDSALRHSFLTNVPAHRAIVAAWEAQGSK